MAGLISKQFLNHCVYCVILFTKAALSSSSVYNIYFLLLHCLSENLLIYIELVYFSLPLYLICLFCYVVYVFIILFVIYSSIMLLFISQFLPIMYYFIFKTQRALIRICCSFFCFSFALYSPPALCISFGNFGILFYLFCKFLVCI